MQKKGGWLKRAFSEAVEILRPYFSKTTRFDNSNAAAEDTGRRIAISCNSSSYPKNLGEELAIPSESI